jgi:hypothetical protein
MSRKEKIGSKMATHRSKTMLLLAKEQELDQNYRKATEDFPNHFEASTHDNKELWSQMDKE